MMGLNSNPPGAFGKCFIECLEQLIEHPELLLQEKFRRILASASQDWTHIVCALNGGNNQRYNLHRFKGKAEEIQDCCFRPLWAQSKKIKENIDWEQILEDVKRVSEIVLYELQNNVITITPCGNQAEITSRSGETRRYSFKNRGDFMGINGEELDKKRLVH